MINRAKITAVGKYLPKKIVSNYDLEKIVDNAEDIDVADDSIKNIFREIINPASMHNDEKVLRTWMLRDLTLHSVVKMIVGVHRSNNINIFIKTMLHCCLNGVAYSPNVPSGINQETDAVLHANYAVHVVRH